MSLTVLETGPSSWLVDAGRPNWRSLGVPLGGAADRAALTIGNALVGNGADALALEFTFAGPTLLAEHSTAAAVFGAPFSITINGSSIQPGTTFSLKPGDMLTVGATTKGVRGYLCVAGGFQNREVLGSRSSLEPITKGTHLHCDSSHCEPRGLGFDSLLNGESTGAIRVLPGPQADWFPERQFLDQSYEVLAASNRMGLRLKGLPVSRRSGELVSEAVSPGAVQITNDGLPVVLGVDGQTIGGYPKIAHVIRADLDHLAQLRPGQAVRFQQVSWQEADILARKRTAVVRNWVARIRAADRSPIREPL